MTDDVSGRERREGIGLWCGMVHIVARRVALCRIAGETLLCCYSVIWVVLGCVILHCWTVLLCWVMLYTVGRYRLAGDKL